MHSVWQSYLPYQVARDLVDHPHADPVGREQRLEAVVLFADISGFTAISEALGATGKAGAEELTLILNSYFEPMIDLIHSYGGSVGKFGGDAMTAFFPYTPATRSAVIPRAVQCAVEMQGRMGDYAAIRTRAGTYGLTMNAGLAAGPILITIVGDPAVRLEYVIAGSALDRCADAEHCADAGEVIVHRTLADAGGDIEYVEKRAPFDRVASLHGRQETAPLAPLDALSPALAKTFSAYLHPTIAQLIRDGQSSFINAHRKVTVLFANFAGFDYDADSGAGAKLQAYLLQVIRIVHRYDGHLNKVDMGDKGSKYIALFGAPVAHEDDEERALRCALELVQLPDVPLSIGVNTGFVYCGQVGSAARQEYTVMGDAVNLAARLMQIARPGQIVVSDATRSTVAEGFTWGPGMSVKVKGKTVPVDAYPLSGLKRQHDLRFQEPHYALPMVGREAELRAVEVRVERALAGEGQIIGITAEAGMGKSRLAAEIIKLVLERGFTGFGGECLSHGISSSYLVWGNILRGLLAIDPSLTGEEQAARLEDALAAVSPGLASRAPLLGRVLSIPIPENDLTRSLDARLRKALLESLLVETVRYKARVSPLLLVLEDCHWIDPLSNDLLEAVGRGIVDLPVLMLVVYRPPEITAVRPKVTHLRYFCQICLTEFTQREAERLIGLKMVHLFGTLGSVPAGFVERITERAQGNPFYIDEMINLIKDRKLDPNDPQVFQALDLPDSLHSLIISRIDQLAEQAQTTLKVASVIGRLFKATWLWGVYPDLGAPEQVRRQLDQLSRLDITPLNRSDPELEYLFKHIVTREVAYESLSLATRTMLHEQIGLYIERSYADSLDRYIDLLAHHYGRGGNLAKQREYFHKAGSAAQDAYANEIAIDYYRRLLPLLPEAERSGVLLELGKVLQLVGQWSPAEETYRRALQLAREANDTHTRARAELAIGILLRVRGAYAEAMTWLERVRGGFEELDDQKGLAGVLLEIGIVHWSRADYSSALACFQEGLELSTRMGDQRGVYRAVGNQGIVYKSQGDYARALACHQQCYQVATELGDRLGVSVAAGNRGNVYLEQGDYLHALECHSENLGVAQELGYRQGVGIAIGNMGDVYLSQGEYATALACFFHNLRIALELGDRLGVSFAAWNIAKVFLYQGRYAQAGKFLSPAVTLGRILDAPYDLCDYLYTCAELYLLQGQVAAAGVANDEALQIAHQLDHREVQFAGWLLDVRLRAAAGQLDLPAAVAEIERHSGEWTDEAEQAAIRYEIWRLDPRQELACQEAADMYAALFARTPNIEYRQRYQELTAERLPAPPALPPLPELVPLTPVDLAPLLKQVEGLIAELSAESGD